MIPIINSSFNEHTMPWELIRICLLHPSESVMRAMFHHQIITGLPKHCPKIINQTPCKICYTSNIATLYKGTNVDTTNLQPGKVIHMASSRFWISVVGHRPQFQPILALWQNHYRRTYLCKTI